MNFSEIKMKNALGKFRIENPNKIWIVDFLTAELYSFKCGRDNKCKLKNIAKAQSKHINFEEFFTMFRSK